MRYRADIDGLRALAIVFVVAYHVGIPGFEGGFVGVDIFFSISGFLIISILTSEWKTNGIIRWGEFYARRIRRLLPAAVAMTILVLLLSSVTLFPLGDIQNTAKSAAASSIFVSNFYFWKNDAGYFDTGLDRTPFAHTWSLSVEEQFYALVPLLFLGAAWFARSANISRPRAQLTFMILALVASLLIAIAICTRHPSAGFYLVPTRVYEFSIGALAGLIPTATLLRFNSKYYQLGRLCLYLALASCIWFPLPKDRFPGPWAVIPSGATALLLWSKLENGTFFIDRWLIHPRIQAIGKLSYGWYLWHWPLLELQSQWYLGQVSMPWRLGAAALSLLIAGISYRLIEYPTHFPVNRTSGSSNVRPKLWFAICATTTCGIIAVAFLLNLHANYLQVHQPQYEAIDWEQKDFAQTTYGCMMAPLSEVRIQSDQCTFWKAPKTKSSTLVILWGDSHADHLVPALKKVAKNLGIDGYLQAIPGCPPLAGISDANIPALTPMIIACQKQNQYLLNHIQELDPKKRLIVVLSARWESYMAIPPVSNELKDQFGSISFPLSYSPNAFSNHLRQTFTAISQRESTSILVVAPVPEMELSAPTCLFRFGAGPCSIPRDQINAYRLPVIEAFKRAGDGLPNVSFVDPIKYFCGEDTCRAGMDRLPYYRDSHHLRASAAENLAPLFQTVINRVLASSE